MRRNLYNRPRSEARGLQSSGAFERFGPTPSCARASFELEHQSFVSRAMRRTFAEQVRGMCARARDSLSFLVSVDAAHEQLDTIDARARAHYRASQRIPSRGTPSPAFSPVGTRE